MGRQYLVGHEPAVIGFFRLAGLTFTANLVDLFFRAIGQGVEPWRQFRFSKVRGQPGEALVKSSFFLIDLSGQEVDIIAGIIPVGRKTASSRRLTSFTGTL